MRITGVATMHAPAGRVWAALNNPNVLVATIPGCERLEPAGPDSYRFTVAAAVASIEGIYTGEVSRSQQQEPSSFVLTGSGAGGPGTVSASVLVRLAGTADGTTELSYDADAAISGLIAGVGQRMLSSVARRMAGEFFSSVDEVLVGEGVVVGQAAALEAPGPVPAPAVPAPAVPRPSADLAPARPPAAPTAAGFVRGVLVGAAVAIAGVAVGRQIRRRTR
ncbi:MAG: SRPBCC family protein [Streptosporangiaceae bacterium]